MKTNLFLLLGTVILVAALTFGWQVTAPPEGQIPQIEKNAEKSLPSFSMETLDGKTYQSSDFAGKFMMINFWASWCAPCVAEFPMLLQLAREYPERLVLVAVSSDRNDEAVQRFISTKLGEEDRAVLEQDNVLIIRDYQSAITFDIFNTAMLPETIIVNPQQYMIKKIVGVDWTPDDIKALIESDAD